MSPPVAVLQTNTIDGSSVLARSFTVEDHAEAERQHIVKGITMAETSRLLAASAA